MQQIGFRWLQIFRLYQMDIVGFLPFTSEIEKVLRQIRIAVFVSDQMSVADDLLSALGNNLRGGKGR